MITTTVNDLAARLGVEYTTASAIIKLMIAQGKASVEGKSANPNGKGKSATLYKVEPIFTLNLQERLEAKS